MEIKRRIYPVKLAKPGGRAVIQWLSVFSG